MTPLERKSALLLCKRIATASEQAARVSGYEREYEALRSVILRQEREHRALGRRMVGDIGARMTTTQATDYFVAQCLATAHEKYPAHGRIESLVGLREDYTRAAILYADGRFASAFRHALGTSEPTRMLRQVLDFDYAKLVAA